MEQRLQKFLSTGHLASISIGADKRHVQDALGVPGWWQGKHSLSLSNSSIWRYGSLQIVFNDIGHVDTLLLHLDSMPFESSATDFDLGLLGGEVDSTTTIEGFVEMLKRDCLPFERHVDMAGKPVIKIENGATVKFSRRIDHERSQMARRPILSDDFCLVGIRIEAEDRGG